MNKKLNTLFFVLIATVFNVLVTILAFVALMLAAGYLLDAFSLGSPGWVFPAAFISSIVISFIVYRLILNAIVRKIKFEDYFDPILGGNRKPPRK